MRGMKRGGEWKLPEGIDGSGRRLHRLVDRSTPFACPFQGYGAPLVFFDWLVGAIEVPEHAGEKDPPIYAAERYSTLRRGHYDLGPGLVAGWSSIVVRGWTPKELREMRIPIDESLQAGELAGVTLWCGCPPGDPCHGDVLSILANRPGHDPDDLRVALAMRWNLPTTFSKWWRR